MIETDISTRSFRLVCAPSEIPAVESLLYAEGFEFVASGISEWARRLTKEPKPLGSSYAAFFGLIYIQEELSLLPPLYLNPAPGSLVLDMCASPGGKVGFLAQLLASGGAAVANEPVTKRCYLMRDNLERLNLMNAVTSRYPGERLPFLPESFSSILLDAPCSGWGTVCKYLEGEEVQEDVKHLLNTQRRLLQKAAEILAPGGRILYSTCTANFRENEEQMRYAADNLGLNIKPLQEIPGLKYEAPQDDDMHGVLRIRSSQSDRGYFFLACLEKPGQGSLEDHSLQEQGLEQNRPRVGKGLNLNTLEEMFCWENLPPGKVELFQKRLVFLPEVARQVLPDDYYWWGATLGRVHKNKFHPNPRMRVLLPTAEEDVSILATRIADLDRLLSGQSLNVSSRQRLMGLYWQDLPLGWLKVKGGRCLWSDRY